MLNEEVILSQLADDVKSREEFAEFIMYLRKDFEINSTQWENITVDKFLEALEAYSNSIVFEYRNNNLEFPKNVPWKIFAKLLYGAAHYE